MKEKQSHTHTHLEKHAPFCGPRVRLECMSGSGVCASCRHLSLSRPTSIHIKRQIVVVVAHLRRPPILQNTGKQYMRHTYKPTRPKGLCEKSETVISDRRRRSLPEKRNRYTVVEWREKKKHRFAPRAKQEGVEYI